MNPPNSRQGPYGSDEFRPFASAAELSRLHELARSWPTATTELDTSDQFRQLTSVFGEAMQNRKLQEYARAAYRYNHALQELQQEDRAFTPSSAVSEAPPITPDPRGRGLPPLRFAPVPVPAADSTMAPPFPGVPNTTFAFMTEFPHSPETLSELESAREGLQSGAISAVETLKGLVDAFRAYLETAERPPQFISSVSKLATDTLSSLTAEIGILYSMDNLAATRYSPPGGPSAQSRGSGSSAGSNSDLPDGRRSARRPSGTSGVGQQPPDSPAHLSPPGPPARGHARAVSAPSLSHINNPSQTSVRGTGRRPR
jgi:hypothetical protein